MGTTSVKNEESLGYSRWSFDFASGDAMKGGNQSLGSTGYLKNYGHIWTNEAYHRGSQLSIAQSTWFWQCSDHAPGIQNCQNYCKFLQFDHGLHLQVWNLDLTTSLFQLAEEHEELEAKSYTVRHFKSFGTASSVNRNPLYLCRIDIIYLKHPQTHANSLLLKKNTLKQGVANMKDRIIKTGTQTLVKNNVKETHTHTPTQQQLNTKWTFHAFRSSKALQHTSTTWEFGRWEAEMLSMTCPIYWIDSFNLSIVSTHDAGRAFRTRFQNAEPALLSIRIFFSVKKANRHSLWTSIQLYILLVGKSDPWIRGKKSRASLSAFSSIGILSGTQNANGGSFKGTETCGNGETPGQNFLRKSSIGILSDIRNANNGSFKGTRTWKWSGSRTKMLLESRLLVFCRILKMQMVVLLNVQGLGNGQAPGQNFLGKPSIVLLSDTTPKQNFLGKSSIGILSGTQNANGGSLKGTGTCGNGETPGQNFLGNVYIGIFSDTQNANGGFFQARDLGKVRPQGKIPTDDVPRKYCPGASTFPSPGIEKNHHLRFEYPTKYQYRHFQRNFVLGSHRSHKSLYLSKNHHLRFEYPTKYQ